MEFIAECGQIDFYTFLGKKFVYFPNSIRRTGFFPEECEVTTN